MCINMSLRNDSSGFCVVQTAYIYIRNKKCMQKSDVDLDGWILNNTRYITESTSSKIRQA